MFYGLCSGYTGIYNGKNSLKCTTNNTLLYVNYTSSFFFNIKKSESKKRKRSQNQSGS